MANLSQFTKVPVDIQKRNGFERSHRVSGTGTCGTLHPVLTKFLIPSTEINLDAVMSVDFPPFATDFKGRVNAAIECFFVPCRLAFAGWKAFVKQGNKNTVSLPWVCAGEIYPIEVFDVTSYFSRPNLLEYLGASLTDIPVDVGEGIVPLMCSIPVTSYHLIYNYWYRNKNIQEDCFNEEYLGLPGKEVVNEILGNNYVGWSTVTDTILGSFHPLGGDSSTSLIADFELCDGHNFFEFRQRNYPKDYFTSAFTSPIGKNNDVYISTEGDKFTIATLRAGNALTQFVERFALGGDDYDDIIFANYGVRPSDAAVNHPIYLGRIRQVVYNRYVDNNSGNTDSSSNRNPFGKTLGAAAARGNVSSSGRLVHGFTTTEHGYLMCLFSVWPDAQYNTGVDRNLLIADITSIPWPLLQGVGMDEIYLYELYGDTTTSKMFTTFGYSERYSWYKFDKDRVVGYLAPGRSLDSFALQRTFATTPELGSDFLQVGKNDMDNVFAVSQSLSGFSFWFDIYFTFRISAPLAAYCIPTLGEPKDARQVWIDNGGRML